MKRKWFLTVVFVLVCMIGIFLESPCLAEPHLASYLEQVATMEAEHGIYETWSFELKKELCEAMIENYLARIDGDITESKVDDIVLQRYGIDGRFDVITFERIMTVEKGSFQRWSAEDKAWYSAMKMRLGTIGDEYIYLLPGDDAISPEKALEIAYQQAMAASSMTLEELKERYDVVWCYLVYAPDYGRKDPEYMIDFFAKGMDPARCYDISNQGIVTSTLDIPQGFRDEEAIALKEAYVQSNPEITEEMTFSAWPLTAKKYYSENIAPVVLENAVGHEEDYEPIEMLAAAQYQYGLPDEKAISQEAALEIATTAMQQTFNLTEQEMQVYSLATVFYDITDVEKPLWKFTIFFNPERIPAQPVGSTKVVHKAIVDAYTGQLILCEQYNKRDNDGSLAFAMKKF